MSLDPYVYPGTDVLRNKLDIRDKDTFHELQIVSSALRVNDLENLPLKGDYDLKHLQDIHKHLFQEVYEWAGEIRTVNISRNNIFCVPEYIESFGAGISKKLKKNNYLKYLPRDNFIEEVADCFGDINAMHPFREGNGRTQQIFLKQLSKEAGYELQWKLASKKEIDYASIASFNGEMKPLENLFDKIVQKEASKEI